MSYAIKYQCRKCSKMRTVSSVWPEAKYFQDLIDRKIPLLCTPCWSINYDRRNNPDKKIREQRCRCKNCFYCKEKKGTCLILNLCTLKERTYIINANSLCGEWINMRLDPKDIKIRSTEDFTKVKSRFELLDL